MKTFHVYKKPGETEAQAVRAAHSKILSAARAMGMTEEQLGKLDEGLKKAIDEVAKDGCGGATAKAVAQTLKELETPLEGAGDVLLTLAKIVPPGRPEGVFVLGSLAGDLNTALYLIENARGVLRELMDANLWRDAEPAPAPGPAAQPAAGEA